MWRDSCGDRSSGNLVFDSEGRPCRVWRPREAPPPPPLPLSRASVGHEPVGVRRTRHATPDDSTAPRRSQEQQPHPLNRHTGGSSPDFASEDGGGSGGSSGGPLITRHQVPTKSDLTLARDARYPVRNPQQGSQQQRRSPPPGHLLPRGRDGIDKVLQMAREAENLYHKLQTRRLRKERKISQQRLSTDLDRQREYRRMLQLAEYQEELVNVYGPSMKNIIADMFFDDESDPAWSLYRSLHSEDITLPTERHHVGKPLEPVDIRAAWASATAQHDRRLPSRSMVAPRATGASDSRSALLTTTTSDWVPSTTNVSREREALHRAMDDHRHNHRMPF